MIEALNISKSFENNAVLAPLSFHVLKGESLVILGQSGTGKSVLLKMLAGLIAQDSGKITMGSQNIGMLFQKNALFDSFSVFENLEFPLRERTSFSRKEREYEVQRFLNWVGLSGTELLYPDELSGGMQKRLGIARALIVKPEIIFYDEPTAGLDPITSRMIVDLILRLSKEMKTTMVSVTSDVQRALQLADTLALLHRPQTSSQNAKIGAQLIPTGTPLQTRKSHDLRVRTFMEPTHVHSV